MKNYDFFLTNNSPARLELNFFSLGSCLAKTFPFPNILRLKHLVKVVQDADTGLVDASLGELAVVRLRLLVSGARKFFIAQLTSIKLVLPQSAWLSLFYSKISSVAPPWGTWINDALLRRYVENRKTPSTAGFEPTACLLQGKCSTAVLQPLPKAGSYKVCLGLGSFDFCLFSLSVAAPWTTRLLCPI